MAKRRKAKKKENLTQWKKGVNNVKDINIKSATNHRGGMRLD